MDRRKIHKSHSGRSKCRSLATPNEIVRTTRTRGSVATSIPTSPYSPGHDRPHLSEAAIILIDYMSDKESYQAYRARLHQKNLEGSPKGIIVTEHRDSLIAQADDRWSTNREPSESQPQAEPFRSGKERGTKPSRVIVGRSQHPWVPEFTERTAPVRPPSGSRASWQSSTRAGRCR